MDAEPPSHRTARAEGAAGPQRLPWPLPVWPWRSHSPRVSLTKMPISTKINPFNLMERCGRPGRRRCFARQASGGLHGSPGSLPASSSTSPPRIFLPNYVSILTLALLAEPPGFSRRPASLLRLHTGSLICLISPELASQAPQISHQAKVLRKHQDHRPRSALPEPTPRVHTPTHEALAPPGAAHFLFPPF